MRSHPATIRTAAAALAAVFTLAIGGPAHGDTDRGQNWVQTLAQGCTTKGSGPTTTGWCHEHRFYGPLYIGNPLQVPKLDKDLLVYGVGQLGFVNAGNYSGVLRVGLANVTDQSTSIDVALGNLALREHRGWQIGGVFAYAEAFYGLQTAPIAIVSDGMVGLQIGAIPLSFQEFAGVQIGGLAYAGKVAGGQIAGIGVSEDVDGFALTAGNMVFGDLVGLSVGAVYTLVFGEMNALQVGAVTYADGDMEGMQLGVVNYAGDHDGLQLGAVNLSDRTQGFQFGIVNYARQLNGWQIGLFNFSKEGGLPFMLLING